MGSHVGRHGWRWASSAGVTVLSMRAVRNSSVLFIGVSKICFFRGENAGSDAHHDKPILLIARAGHDPV